LQQESIKTAKPDKIGATACGKLAGVATGAVGAAMVTSRRQPHAAK
jgi:hypothetical protein